MRLKGRRKFRHDNVTNKKCPECGKPMLAVKGKMQECLYARTEPVDIKK